MFPEGDRSVGGQEQTRAPRRVRSARIERVVARKALIQQRIDHGLIPGGEQNTMQPNPTSRVGVQMFMGGGSNVWGRWGRSEEVGEQEMGVGSREVGAGKWRRSRKQRAGGSTIQNVENEDTDAETKRKTWPPQPLRTSAANLRQSGTNACRCGTEPALSR